MKFFITVLALLFATVQADVFEVRHFREIKRYVTEDCIVLCDIDDTVLIPVQMLGCDEWFCASIARLEAEGVAPSEAFKRILPLWVAVRHMSAMKLVEEETRFIIKNLQEEGKVLMGLTTQGFTMADITNMQLEEVGVSFARSAPSREDIYFNRLKKGHSLGVLYHRGVLFTNGTHKGESFFTFCEKTGYTPKRIVFINDKESHLKEVEESAEKRGVEFIGLRYAYSDKIKELFDFETAEEQLKALPYRNIPSDGQVLKECS